MIPHHVLDNPPFQDTVWKSLGTDADGWLLFEISYRPGVGLKIDISEFTFAFDPECFWSGTMRSDGVLYKVWKRDSLSKQLRQLYQETDKKVDALFVERLVAKEEP